MKDKTSYQIISLLRKHYGDKLKVTANKNEYIIRCPFCGDSKKSDSSHFYINPGDDKKPPVYKCFKCNRSGILTPTVLLQILGNDNLDSSEIDSIKDITLNLKHKINYSALRIGYNKIRHNLLYKYPLEDSVYNKNKLEYLNSRLGLNLTMKEAQSNKIVFNITDLLFKNSIFTKTRTQTTIDEIDKYFIGFISLDNGFVTLRNTKYKEEGKLSAMRYINYNIFSSTQNHIRYYCIPSYVNSLSSSPINIHIAEGCFDILSIFYHLENGNRNNHIYIASNGTGYINPVKVIMEELGISNIVLHVYPDNDVTDKQVYYKLRKLVNIYIPIIVHRNKYKDEKDFGVPKERIDEIIYKIKNETA